MHTEQGEFAELLVYAPIGREIAPGQIVSFNIAPELVTVLVD
jgi:hypothetical protein